VNTNSNPTSDVITNSIRTLVGRGLAAIREELDNTALPDTAAGVFERVLTIYAGIKPLLTVLGSLPLIPSAWRKAMTTFNEALEALAVSAPEVTAAFKAGKDL
jgi:hypothetical protein